MAENVNELEVVNNEVVPPRTLLETYLHPSRAPNPSCIMFPSNMPTYEFKHGMIQLLLIFQGMENENP